MTKEARMFYPGDAVTFELDGKTMTGEVFVCDPRGGGACFGICTSYDIFTDDGVLYKHVPERVVHRAGCEFVEV